MGANAIVLYKPTQIANHRPANFQMERWQLTTSLDYAQSYLSTSTSADICMGWALGQSPAMDKQPNWQHESLTTTYLICIVEFLAWHGGSNNINKHRQTKSTYSVQESLENPTPSPIQVFKQLERPKVLVPVTKSQKAETSKKAQCQPQPTIIMSKTIYSIMVALLFPNRTGNPWEPSIDTQHKTPPLVQVTHQYNSLPTALKPDTSHISSCCCTIALLQLHWNTAWYLMTHWNVETAYAWAGPAQYIGDTNSHKPIEIQG